jgi:hypothetical protein
MGFRILFEITEGPHKGIRVPYEAFFSDKTQERIFDSLAYCGWDGKSIKEAKGLDQHVVSIDIKIEESPPVDKKDDKGKVIGKEPGKKYMRVAWVNDPARAGSIHKVPDVATQDAFEQRIQGPLEAWRAKRNKPVQDTGTSFDFGANAPPDGQQPPTSQPTEAAKSPNPNTGY